MTTKLSRVITCSGRILPSKSREWSRDKSKKPISAFLQYHGHETWQGGNLQLEDTTYLVRWHFDNVVTWQIQKIYIRSSAIPMATKLGMEVTCGEGTPPSKTCEPVISGHVTNSKNLYLHFCNTYGHQIWQDGNLPSEDPTYLVRWNFDNVVTRQILKNYVCSSAILMTTKFGRVASCSGGTPPPKSRGLLITWSRDKFEKLISALPQYLRPSDFEGF